MLSAGGILFGLIMPLAALVALGLCFWATFKPRRQGVAYMALTCSLSSLTLGVDAAFNWLALTVYLRPPGPEVAEAWQGMGKIFLIGLAMSSPSLAWSLTLLRTRHDPT